MSRPLVLSLVLPPPCLAAPLSCRPLVLSPCLVPLSTPLYDNGPSFTSPLSCLYYVFINWIGLGYFVSLAYVGSAKCLGRERTALQGSGGGETGQHEHGQSVQTPHTPPTLPPILSYPILFPSTNLLPFSHPTPLLTSYSSPPTPQSTHLPSHQSPPLHQPHLPLLPHPPQSIPLFIAP